MSLDLVIFKTEEPNKFKLSLRDARYASCGESRPEWTTITTLTRQQARVAVKHGIAEDRANLMPKKREAPPKPGEPKVHSLKANVKIDLKQLRKKSA